MHLALPKTVYRGLEITDSTYSHGVDMRMLFNNMRGKDRKDHAEKDYEILAKMSQVGPMTASAVTRLIRKSKTQAQGFLHRNWNIGDLDCFEVDTIHGTSYKLWLTVDRETPGNAQEACRMSMLGWLYTLAVVDNHNVGWRLFKNNGLVMAEMAVIKNGIEKKWIIDVPRRGEATHPGADLYVFPTIEEGYELAPKGGKFTSDLFIITGNRRFKELFFMKQ